MRSLLLMICCSFVLASCRHKAYPDSSFNIPNNFRDLISPYKVNDTLIFKSSTSMVDSFVISAIDSETVNERPLFMTPRNSKSITVYYRQIPVDKWQEHWYEGGVDEDSKHSRDGTLISIIKFPDNDSTEYYFNFKNFWCSINTIPILKTDTISVNGLNITKLL